MSAKDVHFLLHLRNQVKLYHWQTTSYARHVATDSVVESLDKVIDKYVEIYMGKYGRPKLTGADAVIRLQNLTPAGIVKLIKAAIQYMQKTLTSHLDKMLDTDLINLRDEMQGSLSQLLYLFTLN